MRYAILPAIFLILMVSCKGGQVNENWVYGTEPTADEEEIITKCLKIYHSSLSNIDSFPGGKKEVFQAFSRVNRNDFFDVLKKLYEEEVGIEGKITIAGFFSRHPQSTDFFKELYMSTENMFIKHIAALALFRQKIYDFDTEENLSKFIEANRPHENFFKDFYKYDIIAYELFSKYTKPFSMEALKQRFLQIDAAPGSQEDLENFLIWGVFFDKRIPDYYEILKKKLRRTLSSKEKDISSVLRFIHPEMGEDKEFLEIALWLTKNKNRHSRLAIPVLACFKSTKNRFFQYFKESSDWEKSGLATDERVYFYADYNEKKMLIDHLTERAENVEDDRYFLDSAWFIFKYEKEFPQITRVVYRYFATGTPNNIIAILDNRDLKRSEISLVAKHLENFDKRFALRVATAILRFFYGPSLAEVQKK